ncbi:DUF3828 domain-containing protein [Dyella sp. M7H15-1]|nr:DUF3828 domain-containing protein [Dyella sp. M7H15-1]
MKRFLFFAAAIVIFSLGAFTQQGATAASIPDTPEAKVSAFYTWFIKNDSDQGYPLREKDIEEYVAADTVKRLRNDYSHGGPPNGVDYFLKVQDYDSHDWLTHIATHPAIMLDGVAVVPVTFGSTDKVDVLVFMRKLDGLWKITKVVDTWDYK